jgi:thymidylate kinase
MGLREPAISGDRVKKHRFIVIEGIDGSGKSAVARLLAERLGASCYETPPPPFTCIRHHIDTNASVEVHHLFYLAAVLHASDEIRVLLRTQDVVCVRYVMTTVVYHSVLGSTLQLDVESLPLVEPDYTFLLHVTDEAERQRRIEQRRLKTVADALLDNADLRQHLIIEYEKLSVIHIDTTCLNQGQVVQAIINYL